MFLFLGQGCDSPHLHQVVDFGCLARGRGKTTAVAQKRFIPYNPFALTRSYRVNKQIRAETVRLIDEEGRMLGVMPWYDATRLAIEQKLDLVEVNPKADPPIVKLIDYGKFIYREQKLAREKAKAGHGGGELKAIRLGLGTGKHDIEVRSRQVEKFLAEGARTQIGMVLRGREKAHPDLARKKLEEFLTTIQTPFAREKDIKRTGRGFSIVVWPVKHESSSPSA
ncbi:MAG: translation initiation factor IF-3 [bacterium]|nr:translation initiation factor IF-3 [bacterium]